MSFWTFFGKDKETVRSLDHPKALQIGDVVIFDDHFALPVQLRGQTFTVEKINTYEFEDEHEPEFVLRGSIPETIYLAIDDEDDSYLAISIEIPRATVESLFNMEQFSSVFEPGTGNRIEVVGDEALLKSWFAQSYYKSQDAETAYYYAKQDYRDKQPPQNENSGEKLQYYCLLDDEDEFAIEIEVFASGDTGVCLTIYRPIRDIKELWPSKQGS